MSKSIFDLADVVMQEIEQAELVKTAAVSYTEKQMSSEEAQLLVKVAQQLRSSASDNRITYGDFARFIKANAR